MHPSGNKTISTWVTGKNFSGCSQNIMAATFLISRLSVGPVNKSISSRISVKGRVVKLSTSLLFNCFKMLVNKNSGNVVYLDGLIPAFIEWDAVCKGSYFIKRLASGLNS